MNRSVLKHIAASYGKDWGFWAAVITEAIRAFIGRVVTVVILANMVAAVSVGDFDQAKQLLLIWAVITIVSNLLAAAGEILGVRGENVVYGDLMLDFYKRLVNKDMSFYRDSHTGYLTALIRQYVDGGLLLSRMLRTSILLTFISLTFPVAVLAYYYWPVGIIALLMIISQAVYIFWSSAKANKWRHVSNETYRKISAAVADDVTNIVAYKSAGKEKQAIERMTELRKEENDAFNKRRFTITTLNIPRNLIVTILAAIGFWLALDNTANTEETIAVLVLTTTYFFQILRTVSEVPELVFRYDDLITKMGSTLDVLENTHEDIRDPEDPKPFKPTKGEIQINNLTFRYNDDSSGDNVFSDFNLHVKSGERLGVVGLSGAGKSTLASLIMRFDDIQEGEILIDGTNIKDVAQSDLRSHIAYVPQEPLLFHKSIKDNIAYHNNVATLKDVIRAAKAAHAHEFIDKLPKGYDTIVGERGVKLSGGQKQRVVIARAILKKAPIILFDEATSALDSESEHIIQKAMPEIIGSHTAVVIAHRLSTVAGLDRIIVMHDGTIVEEGTHDQLLNKKGRYYSLWQKQVSEQE